MVQNVCSRLIQSKASSSRGLSWPRGFGMDLSNPRPTLDVKTFKRCPRLAEAMNDCCACSVFNYIPDLHGRETRIAVAGKWVLFTFTPWKMADRDSCKKWNVWSAPKEKQILLICSELEIAGQLDVCATSASVSLPILILNLRLLKVQPGRELSREPFIRAVRV